MKEACRQMDDYFFPTAYRVAKEVDRNETSNVQNKVIGLLERAGGKMLKTDMMRALHIKVKELNEAIEALVASDELEVLTVKPDGKGKVATHYALMNGKVS
jgi:transcription initiation factor IIE alpha subunit